ncbi:transcription termination/antitermination protein NusA [bacterium]|nr:transcription termination/antitermination protein NusA [bacterium]
MIVIDNFSQVAAQIENERGISKETLASAIEQALVSACRRKFHEESVLEGQLDQESGEARIFQVWQIVDAVSNEYTEMTVDEARNFRPAVEIGDVIRNEVTPQDFGRIAAQTAKQVIIQRIREAEKNAIYAEFKDKVGQILVGTVQRVENRNYLINLGKAEAILNFKDQIPGERFMPKEKIRVYISGVDKNSRGTFINISRSHPGLLKRLFELEIPEIQDGIIELVSVSREPGKRAKVAVKSNNPSIGAVGTCVGHLGARIQSIIKELGVEKIDVLEWDENPKVYISNALKPAKVDQVIITDIAAKTAVVVVPNDQLSLAIGKSGINVRLTVKLTSWKVDILSTDEFGKKAGEIREENHLSIVDKIRKSKEADEADELAASAIAKAMVDSDDGVPDHQLKASEFAKILKIKTKDLIERAKTVGIEIASVRSVLSPEQVELLKEKI